MAFTQQSTCQRDDHRDCSCTLHLAMQAALRLNSACSLPGLSAHMVASIKGFVHANTLHAYQAHMLKSVHDMT